MSMWRVGHCLCNLLTAGGQPTTQQVALKFAWLKVHWSTQIILAKISDKLTTNLAKTKSKDPKPKERQTHDNFLARLVSFPYSAERLRRGQDAPGAAAAGAHAPGPPAPPPRTPSAPPPGALPWRPAQHIHHNHRLGGFLCQLHTAGGGQGHFRILQLRWPAVGAQKVPHQRSGFRWSWSWSRTWPHGGHLRWPEDVTYTTAATTLLLDPGRKLILAESHRHGRLDERFHLRILERRRSKCLSLQRCVYLHLLSDVSHFVG